ncbi:MAG: GIY-YIG nuclease family protein [Bacteroidota bacterium]
MKQNIDHLFHLNAHVYILTNKGNTVLYIGITTDLRKRILQHSEGSGGVFTQKYRLNKLVYFEGFDRITDAIHREKQLKNWRRSWKKELITDFNPQWRDLGKEFLM